MKKLTTVLLVTICVSFTHGLAAAQTDDLAQIRFGHLASGLTSVDLYINGQPTALENVAFGFISDWHQLPADTYEFAIVPAGALLEEAFIEQTITIDAEDWYTVITSGIAELDNLGLHIIEEDYSEIPFGETRLSFLHAIPEILPLDVIIDDESFGFLNYVGTSPDEDVQAENFETVTLLEGTRRIEFVNALSGETIADFDEFNYLPDRHYLLAVINVIDNPLTLLVSTPAAPDPVGDLRTPSFDPDMTSGFVRVAHLAAGTPAIDVYFNDQLSDIEGLAFTNITDFIELPVGAYEIAITPAEAGLEAAVLQGALIVRGGEHYTIAVHGLLELDTFEMTVIVEDFSPLDRGLFRLTVFHGMFGTGAVSVIRDDGLELISFVSYPGTSDESGYTFAEVVTGSYGFSIVDAADPATIIIELPLIAYGAGRNYFIGLIPGSYVWTVAEVE